MGLTSIEWADATWNPVRGCTRVSAGCENCYAESFAARFGKVEGHAFEGFARMVGHDARWTGRVELIPEKLGEPLSWRKPKRVFTNSMSDLFHEALPDESIESVFRIMALAKHHTFQVLTKRPARMREFCLNWSRKRSYTFPPNVWLGVSVEDQKTADDRIPLLLQTPAAVRFVSYEPALGPVDFDRLMCLSCKRAFPSRPRPGLPQECPHCGIEDGDDQDCLHLRWITPMYGNPRLDWIIVGGESGHEARVFDIAWARSVVAQCKLAHVPVFVKQLGRWIKLNGVEDIKRPFGLWPERYLHADGSTFVPGIIGGHTHDGAQGAIAFSLGGRNRKGSDMAEWPEDLRVREFPTS